MAVRTLFLALAFAAVSVAILGLPVAFYNIMTAQDKLARAAGAFALFGAMPMVAIWRVLFAAIFGRKGEEQ